MLWFGFLIALSAILLLAVWMFVVHVRLLHTEDRVRLLFEEIPATYGERVLAERIRRVEDKCSRCGH
jgi:hypothetical protein